MGRALDDIGNPLRIGRRVGGGGGDLVLTPTERARHVYVVGRSRTGKSKLLEYGIREDILAWPDTRCGVVLIDPHGSLYSNVVRWMAAEGLSHLPVVPVDLRRGDWVVGYNPLRDRGAGRGDPGVVVSGFVRGILHAWGQSNSTETPRLAKFLSATLTTLMENRLALTEALQLLGDPDLRREMTAAVSNDAARLAWATAPRREAEFQEMVESTVSRLVRFLGTRVLKACFGQADGASLDFDQALRRGSIVLVSLSTEGGHVDDEDAAMFGSLLLSDLWSSARARGKRDEGLLRPTYVYIDEFQEVLNPTMAKTLDQASGFGLHMHLAHQFPSQLLAAGEHGRMVFNSVLNNAGTKVVFQLSHTEDLETLAQMLYMHEVDPDKVKYRQHTTKVLGYNLAYLPSYSTGVTHGEESGWSKGRTRGGGRSVGTNWSHTDTASESTTVTEGSTVTESESVTESDSLSSGVSVSESDTESLTEGKSDALGTSRGESESDSVTSGSSEGESWSDGTNSTRGGSAGRSSGRSQSRSFGKPTKALQEGMERYRENRRLEGPGSQPARENGATPKEFQEKFGAYAGEWPEKEDRREAFEREHVTDLSISESEGGDESESWSDGSSSSAGGSRSRSASQGRTRGTDRGETRSHTDSAGRGRSRGHTTAVQLGHSHGLAVTAGTSVAESVSEARSVGTSASDSHGGSESWDRTWSASVGRSGSRSLATSSGTSVGPMLMPVMGTEPLPPQFYSVQEQLWRAMQFLNGQPDRHCTVRVVGGRSPVPLVTFAVGEAETTDGGAERWVVRTLKRIAYAFPTDHGLQQLERRQAALALRLLPGAEAEPSPLPRRVVVRPAAVRSAALSDPLDGGAG